MPRRPSDSYKDKKYCKLAGELIWMGCVVLPQPSLASSILQQQLPRFNVEGILESNRTLKELRELKTEICYIAPHSGSSPTLYKFSDACFNISSAQSYSQSEVLNGSHFRTINEQPPIYHIIDWSSANNQEFLTLQMVQRFFHAQKQTIVDSISEKP